MHERSYITCYYSYYLSPRSSGLGEEWTPYSSLESPFSRVLELIDPGEEVRG